MMCPKKQTMLFAMLSMGLFGVSTAMADVATCAAGTGGPTPTNTVSPTDCTGQIPGTLLASMSATFSYSTTSGTNSGVIDSAVYNDGGTLDFYYQVSNDPTSATVLARLAAADFLGFTTDAAFRTDGSTLTGTEFVNGSKAPITADSNADGSIIGFSFFPGTSTEIGPGSASYVLIISTNATNFAAGNASVIDGGTDTVASFQPIASAVPEPRFYSMLLFAGIVAGAVFYRRRFRTT